MEITLSPDAGSQVDALANELEDAKVSANKIAAQTVASLGIPEGTIKPSVSDTLTPAEYAAKFKTLTGQERANFFAKHEKEIVQGFGVKP